MHNRQMINKNNDDDHYKTLVERQAKPDKIYDTLIHHNSIQIGDAVVVK